MFAPRSACRIIRDLRRPCEVRAAGTPASLALRENQPEAPFAERSKAEDDAEIPMFRREDINVLVTGGEANGYWQIYGAKPQATVLVDDWR